jgi:hypothetical protein
LIILNAIGSRSQSLKWLNLGGNKKGDSNEIITSFKTLLNQSHNLEHLDISSLGLTA